MKISKIVCAALVYLTVVSCSKSNDDNNKGDGGTSESNGSVILKFDNGVGDQDFIFNTTYNKSNDESYQLKDVKYIISNIRLKDKNGTEYMYPKDKNIFIVSEANGNNAGEIKIELDGVDSGSYNEITFGIGVDQERYKLGAKGQGDFLEKAEEEGMTWTWATGYKFTLINGECSYDGNTGENIAIHVGSLGTTVDNYEEVTLALPNSIKVSDGKKPEVHVFANLSKLFDGNKALHFIDGYNEVHTNAEKMNDIMGNITRMFSVSHVHNQ